MKHETKKHVIQVLSVLLTAVFCAAILATYMIYRYNPSGQYIAGNTILAPSLMAQLSYSDKQPLTGRQTSSVFHGIQLTYFDKINKQYRQVFVKLSDYEAFYHLVESTLSLKDVTESTKLKFDKDLAATLQLIVKDEAATSQSDLTRIFQRIQFTTDDYFRVELKGESRQGEWAYFYQPHLYQSLIHLFNKVE